MCFVGTSRKSALEAVGISVGPRTTRDRLLELLDHHIKKKKPRLCTPRQRIRSKKDVKVQSGERVAKDISIVVPASQVQPDPVDFSRFEVDELQRMVSEVGVDPAGMKKTDLIQSCQKHQHLSEFCDFSITYNL